MEDIIKTLEEQKVFSLKDASVELFFDDEGILQEMLFKRKRRRRDGETLALLSVSNGKAIGSYDNDGTLQKIVYETKWRRKLPSK